jgi:hypothetical protein
MHIDAMWYRMDKNPRTTATLTPEQGRVLRAMAEQHKVSVAWLIRHAVDRLIDDEREGLQLPLDISKGQSWIR